MDDRYRPEEKPLILRRSTSNNRGMSKTRNYACGAILLTVMLERLAFYGITFYFVLFLSESPFCWLQYDAASAVLMFLTISYMFSVVAGVIADSFLGRFVTLVISFLFCIFASGMMIALGKAKQNYSKKDPVLFDEICNVYKNSSAIHDGCPQEEPLSAMYCSKCFVPVIVALVVYAIGSGSLRANLTPFGAEQVKYGGSQRMHSFFNWYYWAINVGSLIALLGVSYIQQNINFFIGYIIPSTCLILAGLVFVIGRCWYMTKKPTGSVLSNTFRILFEACKRRKHRRVISNRMNNDSMLGFGPVPSFLDMAKDRYGGSFHDSIVEDVKSLGKVCVVFIALVPYWIVYYQMQTTFVIQGLHLNIFHENASSGRDFPFTVPVAWISVFNILAVLLLLPLMDRVVFMLLEKRGWHFSQLKRMTMGMFFSVLAVLCAGVLENRRLFCINNDPLGCLVNQTIGNTTYNAATIPVFAQIPQYFLIGVSEVFASVAGLEFAFSQAPRSMQGLIMGLFYVSSGLGTLFGSLFIKMVSGPNSWLKPTDTGNINHSHLDYYFFTLSAVQFVASVLFCCLTCYFERKSKPEPNIQEEQDHVRNYMSVEESS